MSDFDDVHLNDVFPFDDEPPFTEAELQNALTWRQRVTPDPWHKRRDQCPHDPMCPSLSYCLENIAWYFRHRDVVDAKEREIARRNGAYK